MEEHHNVGKLIKQHARGCLSSSTCYPGNDKSDDPNFEHPEPSQAIFSIHLIYLKILKNLNAIDLLACRQVNSVLHLGANELLTKRNLLSLTFQYDSLQSNYYLTQSYPSFPVSTNTTKITDLSTFTKTFGASPNFPCTSFQFLNGSLNSEPLQTFLTLQGHRIQQLVLDVYHPEETDPVPLLGQEPDSNTPVKTKYIPTFATLRYLLIRQAPNLFSLTLQKCPSEWPQLFSASRRERLFLCGSPRSPSPKFKVVLPYLKTFSYDIGKDGMSFALVEDILKAAPNLKSVDSKVDIPMLYANKFHLMKFFEFSPDFIELYQQNCLINIKSSQLKRLYISLFRLISTPQLQEAARLVLSSLLNASTTTLTCIKISAPLGLLGDPDFVLPKCPAVTFIKITTREIVPYMMENIELPTNRDPATLKYFPKGFQFKETFPALSHVTFRFKHVLISSEWDSFFFHDLQPVPTVKSLIFMKSEILPANTIAHCSRIFTNVVFLSVQVERFNFYESALNGLWEFKKLKEFSCDIYLAANCGNVFPYMDSAFTGFSLETSRRFGNALSLRENDFSDLDGLTEYPSILMLTEFQKLNVRFIDESLEPQEFYATIFTEATCAGAFLKLPKLQVTVEINAGFAENRIRIIRAIQGILPAVQLLQA